MDVPTESPHWNEVGKTEGVLGGVGVSNGSVEVHTRTLNFWGKKLAIWLHHFGRWEILVIIFHIFFFFYNLYTKQLAKPD